LQCDRARDDGIAAGLAVAQISANDGTEIMNCPVDAYIKGPRKEAAINFRFLKTALEANQV
jgi:hypothetical protein